MIPLPPLGAAELGAIFGASSSSKSSSGSPIFLIFLLLLFAVYFLWLRPQRQKLRAQNVQRSAPVEGDEVVTTGGIIGRITAIEGDRAELEVAPGQSLTIHRSALGRRLDPPIPESADDDIDGYHDHDHDHDGDHDHDHDHGATDADGGTEWWPGGSHGDTGPSEEPE